MFDARKTIHSIWINQKTTWNGFESGAKQFPSLILTFFRQYIIGEKYT